MHKKSYLRILGDCHGAISVPRSDPITRIAAGRTYLNIIKKCEYSVQLGDMGFDYEKLEHIDESRHCFIGGNHDNYYTLLNSKVKGYLGDYGFNGLIPNFPFFFGAIVNSLFWLYKENRDKNRGAFAESF